MVKKFIDEFVGKNEKEKLDVMEKMLYQQGFSQEIVERKDGTKTYWFSKDGVDNVFATAVNKHGEYLLLILPKDFAKHLYAKNGKFIRCICVQGHSYKNKSLVAKFSSRRLHRLIYDFYGEDISDDLEVDHISGHQGVIILVELRKVTSKQNKYNKRGRKTKDGSEFDYNKFHDFRDSFWIPFLHYVLGVISKEDMETLRQMELALETDEA